MSGRISDDAVLRANGVEIAEKNQSRNLSPQSVSNAIRLTQSRTGSVVVAGLFSMRARREKSYRKRMRSRIWISSLR
jgi:hypothetical protein